MRWPRRGANDFSFSEILSLPRSKLSCRMQGKTRPRIQYTKDFTHYIESVAGVAPPMPGIEGITGGGAHNGPALAGNEPAPKQANAPRVDFCRDQNHGLAIRERKRGGGNSDFVDGIHNGGFEAWNRFRRHTFVN